MVCSASDDGGEPSKPTAACWVGARANCFAVGYDDGSVLVYGIPPSALKGERAERWRGLQTCPGGLRDVPRGARV
jgi:hypothetical protein